MTATLPPHHPGTITETISDILMDMDLPDAIHAMVPVYISILAYRVERESLSFRGTWEGAQVECVISTRHSSPTVTVTITA